jgi:ferredoxin
MPILQLGPARQRIEVSRGTRLIDAIRAAGFPIARSCGDDLVCAKCGVRVLEGRVSDERAAERRVKRANRVPDELRLACAIRVRDDLVVTADYWGGEEPA